MTNIATEAQEQADIRIVIDAIPPSLNRFAGRKNAWEYRKCKAEWKELVFYSYINTAQIRKKGQPETIDKAVVTITYYFPNRHRHDPDNYNGKMILDGLTAAEIIRDDSFDCIELRLRGACDRKRPRTEIEIVPKHTR